MGDGGQAGGPLASKAPDIPSLAGSTLPRQTPEVGAVCGNAALTVLCGGRPVMGVPTAIKIAKIAVRPAAAPGEHYRAGSVVP